MSDSLSPLMAVLYHRRGLAQNEIARMLGLSAMKASRLLQRARMWSACTELVFGVGSLAGGAPVPTPLGKGS